MDKIYRRKEIKEAGENFIIRSFIFCTLWRILLAASNKG
jgi:hypothetical protein